MNNYAKYQHPKQKFITFLKKNGPVKEKKFDTFFLFYRTWMNNCTKFDPLGMKFSNKSPPTGFKTTDPPPPFEFFSQNINGFIQLILSRDPNEPKCEI